MALFNTGRPHLRGGPFSVGSSPSSRLIFPFRVSCCSFQLHFLVTVFILFERSCIQEAGYLRCRQTLVRKPAPGFLSSQETLKGRGVIHPGGGAAAGNSSRLRVKWCLFTAFRAWRLSYWSNSCSVMCKDLLSWTVQYRFPSDHQFPHLPVSDSSPSLSPPRASWKIVTKPNLHSGPSYCFVFLFADLGPSASPSCKNVGKKLSV